MNKFYQEIATKEFIENQNMQIWTVVAPIVNNLEEPIYNSDLDDIIERTIVKYQNDKITTIGDSTFSYCKKLTSINCLQVTNIGYEAFSHCFALTSINFPKLNEIGAYAFSHCSALTSITLPKVTTINYFAFSSCIALSSINLPEVTRIGAQAFNRCDSLTSISLPKLDRIDDYGFCNCTALTSVILSSPKIVFFYGSNLFDNTPIEAGTGYIYVPADLVDKYKANPYWSIYADQIRAIGGII